MRAVKIWNSSGFVTPIATIPGSLHQQFDEWTSGDSDASVYHTLPGLTFRNYADAAKTIEIARKAVSLFGGTDLFNFVHTNLLYNRFKSDLHYRFLNDTLDYIKTGKRTMSILTWMRLLISPTQGISKKHASKTAYTMNSDCYRNVTVMNWLSRDGGLQDLVITLYIIFGKY